MRLNEVTGRNYAIYLTVAGEIELDPEAERYPVLTVGRYIRAAVAAGIAEDVPADFAAGDLAAVHPGRVNQMLDVALTIKRHIDAALDGVPGEA
jgi:hypothetical protein